MAPRSNKKTEEEKKGDGEEQPPTSIDFEGRGFTGELILGGRKVRCLMHPRAGVGRRRRRGAANRCNAVINNKRRDIQCHISRKHDEKSAHARDMKKDPNNPWICPCEPGKPIDNWHNYYSHLRRVHDFKGESKSIRLAGGARIDPQTNKVTGPKATAAEGGNEADEEDDEWDPEVEFEWEFDPVDILNGPEYKDDDDDNGAFGPSGAADGPLKATA